MVEESTHNLKIKGSKKLFFYSEKIFNWAPLRCSAEIGSFLAHKCETRLKNVAMGKYDLAYFAD